MKEKELNAILNRIFPSTRWPKPFNLLQGKALVKRGTPVQQAARAVGTTNAVLASFLAHRNIVSALFGAGTPAEEDRRSTRQILGNLIVGKCAEIIFEELYRRHTHTTELELRDLREGRSDTDYRLHNGHGRPVYRINIKFHGSLFRRAKEMVDLEPEDCFPLATYKISGALEKQRVDELPYIFVVVTVPNLTADSIGASIPADLLKFASRVTWSEQIPKKRDIEDALISTLQRDEHPSFREVKDRIGHANWYVLGAKKADKLLREKLFERVFALRTRSFSRQFRGAELDMHFSFSGDLTPLTTYLDTLRESGYPRVTTLLERGDY